MQSKHNEGCDLKGHSVCYEKTSGEGVEAFVISSGLT